MSRRRRGRSVPPADAVLPGQHGPHVVVNLAQLTIGDIALFGRLSAVAGDDAAAAALMPEIAAMLDRLVVGGASHRPADQLGAILNQVTAAVNRTSNPGN